MANGNVMDDVRAQVEGRLKELEPLVKEYDELRRIAAAIKGDSPPSLRESAGSGRAVPRRRLKSTGPGSAGHSARADEAKKLIAAEPGIAVKDLAQRMGIGPTYLYRLLPRLEREGALRKEGHGYHLAKS